MKKYGKMMALVLAACLSTAVLGSCTSTETPSEDVLESSAALVEVEPETLTVEEAEQLVKERLPLDFENTYTLSVNEEKLEWNGREYCQLLISDEQITLETSVLVDLENRQIFTYYPDGSAYAPEDDPVCKSLAEKSGEETESSSTSGSSGNETGGETAESGLEWKGTYQNDSGIILAIEPQDPNSFEFTLTSPDGVGLETQIARSEGSGSAVSTSTEGLTVTFTQKGNAILIQTEGTLPEGFSPDGEYNPIEG